MLDRMRFLSLLGALAVLGVASACVSTALEALPLTVSVEASRTTAAAQDTINVVIKASGGQLIGIDADYGDGTIDTYNTAGARTASVTFKHVFAARGTYVVTATVIDVSAGSKKATVEIRVN
jgi:hypothetical protein